MNYNNVSVKYVDGTMKRISGVIESDINSNVLWVKRTAYNGSEQLWFMPLNNILSIRMINKDDDEPDDD